MTQEIEAKFALTKLVDFRQHLLDRGARLVRDRVLERNWRFDKADSSLTAAGKVLRLRQDIAATLTFKQGGEDPLTRTEIEFEVNKPSEAKEFIEALGYQVILVYEKYRESFAYQGAEVELDQLPFGSFIEIEARSVPELKRVSKELGLDWKRRVPMSYAELFERWQERSGNTVRDATFAALADLKSLDLDELGLMDAYADQRAGLTNS